MRRVIAALSATPIRVHSVTLSTDGSELPLVTALTIRPEDVSGACDAIADSHESRVIWATTGLTRKTCIGGVTVTVGTANPCPGAAS